MVNRDPQGFTLTTTAQKIAKYDPKRTSITIINTGTTTGYIAFKNTTDTNQAIPLFASASVALFLVDGEESREALWGFHASATVTIIVIEQGSRELLDIVKGRRRAEEER